MRHADIGSARKPSTRKIRQEERPTLQSPRGWNDKCHQKEDPKQHTYCGHNVVSIRLRNTLSVDLFAKVFTMLRDTFSSCESN